MKNWTPYLFLFLKGMLMGAADVIPGVSGGTIAFITGIYERLLNAIKSVNPSLVKTLRKEGVKSVWQQIDGTFLVVLFAGIFTSLLSLAGIISWLLVEYRELLWAFFFGLIIASAIFIGKQIKQWTPQTIVALVLGTGIAYYITIASPAEGSITSPLFVFLSGCIAICAMILPGISGSFILLLLGMYGYVMGAVKDLNLPIMALFASGCLVGLLSFSHVLSWTFRKFRSTTLALLTGFLIGSLNKVWPWKKVLQYRTNSHGEQVPFLEQNVLPMNYEGEAYLIGAIVLTVVGFVVVFLLERLGEKEK